MPSHIPGTQRAARFRAVLDETRAQDARRTFLERVILWDEADKLTCGLPQARRLGEGAVHLFALLSVPVRPDDLLLGRVVMTVPDAAQEAFFQARVKQWGSSCAPWAVYSSHETIAWGRLLELGLPGLEQTARTQLQRVQSENPNDPRLDFLSGAVRVYDGWRLYARRWAEAGRAAGCHDAAQRCAALAERPPETFAEALQLVWLVGLPLIMVFSGGAAVTFSRMDDILLPFYERDIAAGRVTYEQAVRLMDDFFLKIYTLSGIGEHQLTDPGQKPITGFRRNPIFDGSIYVIVGGRRTSGPVTNAVTDVVLDTARLATAGLKNPVVIVRYSHDLPDACWDRITDLVLGNASLFIYNDETMIPALESWGVKPADALEYSLYGCNDPHITGKEGSMVQCWPNVAAMVRDVVLQRDSFTDRASLLQAFLQRFRKELTGSVGPMLDGIEAQASRHTLRINDCFLDGPIERVCHWQTGGVDYYHCLLQLCGVATAIDSLAAVAHVCIEGGVPVPDVAAALHADFAGRENLRARLLAAPKFGVDDPFTDALAHDVVAGLCAVIEDVNAATSRRYRMIPCISTDMNHVRMGRGTGATPDGRRAGAPISENQSPGPGNARKGLTALFNSLLHIPFTRITGGPLNVVLEPSMFRGKEKVLGQALRSYLDRGGMQLQVSTVDRAVLRQAQEHPERYRDLMVRVTGYSSYFVEMDRAAQEEFMRRLG